VRRFAGEHSETPPPSPLPPTSSPPPTAPSPAPSALHPRVISRASSRLRWRVCVWSRKGAHAARSRPFTSLSVSLSVSVDYPSFSLLREQCGSALLIFSLSSSVFFSPVLFLPTERKLRSGALTLLSFHDNFHSARLCEIRTRHEAVPLFSLSLPSILLLCSVLARRPARGCLLHVGPAREHSGSRDSHETIDTMIPGSSPPPHFVSIGTFSAVRPAYFCRFDDRNRCDECGNGERNRGRFVKSPGWIFQRCGKKRSRQRKVVGSATPTGRVHLSKQGRRVSVEFLEAKIYFFEEDV